METLQFVLISSPLGERAILTILLGLYLVAFSNVPLPLPVKIQQVPVTNLVCYGLLFPCKFNTKITFSLQKLDKICCFFSFLKNFVPHLMFSLSILHRYAWFSRPFFLK